MSHRRRGQGAFQVLIVHGQIVDLHDLERQLSIGEPHQGSRRLAVDGLSAIAAHNDSDVDRLACLAPFESPSDTEAK